MEGAGSNPRPSSNRLGVGECTRTHPPTGSAPTTFLVEHRVASGRRPRRPETPGHQDSFATHLRTGTMRKFSEIGGLARAPHSVCTEECCPQPEPIRHDFKGPVLAASDVVSDNAIRGRSAIRGSTLVQIHEFESERLCWGHTRPNLRLSAPVAPKRNHDFSRMRHAQLGSGGTPGRVQRDGTIHRTTGVHPSKPYGTACGICSPSQSNPSMAWRRGSDPRINGPESGGRPARLKRVKKMTSLRPNDVHRARTIHVYVTHAFGNATPCVRSGAVGVQAGPISRCN